MITSEQQDGFWETLTSLYLELRLLYHYANKIFYWEHMAFPTGEMRRVKMKLKKCSNTPSLWHHRVYNKVLERSKLGQRDKAHNLARSCSRIC